MTSNGDIGTQPLPQSFVVRWFDNVVTTDEGEVLYSVVYRGDWSWRWNYHTERTLHFRSTIVATIEMSRQWKVFDANKQLLGTAAKKGYGVIDSADQYILQLDPVRRGRLTFWEGPKTWRIEARVDKRDFRSDSDLGELVYKPYGEHFTWKRILRWLSQPSAVYVRLRQKPTPNQMSMLITLALKVLDDRRPSD